MSIAATRILLEFVPSPERSVFQVAGWLTFFHESSGVKNSVVGLKPQVPIRLPAHFRARTMPDETRVALSCGNDQESWNGIHSVSHALPPLEDPIHGHSHVARQRRFNVRMCVDEVDRARPSGGEDAKIVAFRKQGIERAEWVCARVVANGDISLAELLPIRRDWTRARLDYLEALNEVTQAWAALSPYV